MLREKKQEEGHVRCEACDYQKLKEMENDPTVRELRDKIEQLNFRLTECKTENQVLKRNLQLAKQMIYKEVGNDSLLNEDMKKQGLDGGRRKRTEMIFLLKRKVEELQQYLNQLEGKSSSGKVLQSDESCREQLAADRKLFWRLELERRRARETADKDLDPLVKESTELRRKMEAEKLRFKELTSELNLLRKKLQTQVDRNEQDMGLSTSFHNLENQLQDCLAQRAEIRMELAGSKACNKRLEEEIAALRGEFQALSNKAKDNNKLIDSYTNKHKQIQEAIEKEKVFVQEHAQLHKLEIEELKSNYSLDATTLNSLQSFCRERHDILSQLESDISAGLMANMEMPRINKKNSQNDKKNVPVTNLNSKETLKKKDKINNTNEEDKITDVDEEDSKPSNDKSTWLKKKIKLLFEFVKYKSLLGAARNERIQLNNIAENQEKKMKNYAVKVIENERLIRQNKNEKADLIEKISRLQKTLAKKKIFSVEPINQLRELHIKIESQKAENDTIRSFLYNLVLTRTRDLVFYKQLFYDNKDHFVKTLQESFESLKEMTDSSSVNDSTKKKNDASKAP